MSGFLHLSDFHLVEDETISSRAFNAKYILKNTVDKILGKNEDFGDLDGVIITGDIRMMGVQQVTQTRMIS